MGDEHSLNAQSFFRIRRLSSDPPVLFARELSSTNDVLKHLVEEGLIQPWSALVCGSQIMGRGRPGNRWTSRRGDLAMSQWIEKGSFLLPAHVPISLYVARACLSVLDSLGFSSVFWKYPNDIYACRSTEDFAGKLGGILVEPATRRTGDPQGRVQGWVCGIGLNVLPRHFDELNRPIAGDSSSPEQGRLGLGDLTREGLVEKGSGRMSVGPLELAVSLSRKLKEIFLEESEEEVRSHLEGRLLWKNRWILYSMNGQNGFGQVSGLGPGGELRMVDAHGQACYLGAHVRNVRLFSNSGSS